jgi:hypothetical protein
MKTCLSLTSLAAFSLLWLSSAQNTTAAGLTPAPTSANNTAGSLKSQAQVETATAVGTITSTGNAKVTLTSANIDAGTPLVFLVAVTSGDTSSVWADKVRLALSADLQVAELFEVGGTGGAITLKRKPQLEGEGVSYYAANDSTLNLALDNDTATGITTATSSEDTTAGFLASTAQVETATADGTITKAGNARVIVTAAGLPGSPKAYTVPVLLNDAASAWATKVRTALIADSSLTSLYDVGVSGTSITLTRKKVSIVSGKDIFAVNDPTLNINIDNNTCAGIIPQSISSNTTAGTLQNAGQVETATALGAVTTPGNLQVVVTSDTLLQKPSTTPLEINGKWTAKKLIEVPVLAGDSTSAWAVKVRTALNADADVSNLFTASGTGSKIVLSRKADNVSPGLSIFADNDPTLNLALVTGSKGILPKLTSTNTTAGELASVAQVEIATAAGTINTNGTLEVVVTAAGLPGSPKSINVPVLAGDAATNWAAKVRTVLNADSDITNLFVVGGAGESIQLTSKLMVTLDGVDIYPVNDPTLNIALVIDSDGDKLADFDEIYVHLTDPKKADTDDDGFTDFTEVQATPPSDPKDPNSKPPFTPPTYYDKSQYVDQVDVKISQPYTPFGNRPEFNRYGDDGSKCVLDANGVLTWTGNKGEVRLLPDSSKAIPLFVTNTECLVWVNRFVDYATYPDRPDAQLRLYRSTPESNAVTSQDVSFQGKEIIDTPQVTTTTGTLTFVSATRKDNGKETPVPNAESQNNSDDCELRFYRLTFDAGVQFVGATTLPIRAVADFATNVVGANASPIGYGSDGSLAIRIPEVQTNPKERPALYELNQTYWIDSQGRFLRVQADDNVAAGYQPQNGSTITGTTTTPGVDIDRALFVSNTRLMFEHSGSSQGIQEQRRSSTTGNLLTSSIKDLTASVSGVVLDIWNYSQVGVNRYFYTVNTSDEVAGGPDDTGTIIRTYRVTSNGISEVAKSTLTGGLTITPATMTGTVNTNDGSALLVTEDGDAVIWLHAAGYTALPTSDKASALFVDKDQAVIWENAKAPVGGNGQIPNAIVKHYKQDGTVATTIRTDGNKTLLNTSRLTPDPEYWFFTTATKTDASTSRLVTYRLGTVEINNPTTDSDGDGVTDNDELNIYNTNPLKPDSDGDGLSDLTELLVLFSNANDPVGTGFMTPSVPDANANNSSYEGLLYGEQTGIAGKVTFNVTGTTPKTFTGTYQDIYGVSSPLQGTFDGDGELATFSSSPSLELDWADINIVLQKQTNNKYHIHLAIDSGANGMQYAKARPALGTYTPLRSRLTFEAKLSNSESVPSGAAIATGTLTTAADANFQIYLPDGSTSAYAGKILDEEIIALHTKSASTGTPSFLGNLKLDNRSNLISNLSGVTRLFSDASNYDQVRELTGAYYRAPSSTSLPLLSFTPGTSNSVFGWSQGELGGAYQVVSWTPIGITPPTTAYDSMTPTPTFTPSTGLMKVDYIRSDRDRNLYQDKSTAWAVVNQGRSTVNGFYIGSPGRNWVGGSFSVIPNTTRLTPPDVPLPPEPPIIPGIVSSITPTSKSVGAALSTYEITVNGTDNWQVEIPETAPWISAEVVSNDGSTWADKLTGRGSAKITVTVQANDDFSNREAVIKIGNLEKGYLEHKITQSAGTVTSINPTSMQAVTEGNAYTIRVLATGTWRAVASTPAWIKAEVVNDNGFVPAATGTGGGTGAASNLVGQGNATINVTIDPNATPNMRTGSILIGDKTHSVTQRPVFLAGTVTSISSTSRNVAATASTYTFRVTGKDNWRTVVTGGSWLKAEVINDDGYVAAGNLTGSGNATIKVTVAANSTVNRRTGTIKVGDKVHTVVQAPIIERGSVTSINPTKRDVRAAQTSYTISVTGVKNWTISIPASSSWIKVKVVNDNRFIYAAAPNVTGSGNATIQVTVATNATNRRRSGTINIGGRIHTINQAFR